MIILPYQCKNIHCSERLNTVDRSGVENTLCVRCHKEMIVVSNEIDQANDIEVNKIKEFWMVWRPDGNGPSKQHETSLTAIDEAERLSLKFPDKDFHVLRCIGKFRSQANTTWSDAI